MENTFTYKEKFSIWIFAPVVAFGFMAYYCFINKAGIAIKSFTILPYPYSTYVMVLGVLIFTIVAIRSFINIANGKHNDTLTIDTETLSIPKGKNEHISIKLQNISSLNMNKKEGELTIWYDNNQAIELDKDNFDTEEKFNQFLTQLSNTVNQ